MIAFAQLAKKRQALILQLMEIFPACKETGTISLKEIKQYKAWVKDGKYDQPHHPMFIYGEKEFRTGIPGVYNIPMPQPGDIVEHYQSNNTKPKKRKVLIVDPEDNDDLGFTIDTSILSVEEFEAECKAAGIV